MSVFSFRLKDGDCVIVYAKDEAAATEILKKMGLQTSAANVRKITRFVANFALTDAGDLQTTLLDPGTLKEFAQDYPLLQAAREHSYADFGSSKTDDPSNPVLFDDAARLHLSAWNQRDKDLIAYAVQQERQRLSD